MAIDANDREKRIKELTLERDVARNVLATAQEKVDRLTYELSELLVRHIEDDHNIAVLSREAGSLRGYHRQARHDAKGLPLFAIEATVEDAL